MEYKEVECDYVYCEEKFEYKFGKKYCCRECKQKNRQYMKYHTDDEWRKEKIKSVIENRKNKKND